MAAQRGGTSLRRGSYPPMLAPFPVQAVGTRSNIQCLEKWYSQLSPSMVARGEWGSGDDRRLLRALFLRWGSAVPCWLHVLANPARSGFF